MAAPRHKAALILSDGSAITSDLGSTDLLPTGLQSQGYYVAVTSTT